MDEVLMGLGEYWDRNCGAAQLSACSEPWRTSRSTSSGTSRDRRLEHLRHEHKADAVAAVQLLLGLHPLAAVLGFGDNAELGTPGFTVRVRSRRGRNIRAGLHFRRGDFGGVL